MVAATVWFLVGAAVVLREGLEGVVGAELVRMHDPRLNSCQLACPNLDSTSKSNEKFS